MWAGLIADQTSAEAVVVNSLSVSKYESLLQPCESTDLLGAIILHMGGEIARRTAYWMQQVWFSVVNISFNLSTAIGK